MSFIYLVQILKGCWDVSGNYYPANLTFKIYWMFLPKHFAKSIMKTVLCRKMCQTSMWQTSRSWNLCEILFNKDWEEHLIFRAYQQWAENRTLDFNTFYVQTMYQDRHFSDTGENSSWLAQMNSRELNVLLVIHAYAVTIIYFKVHEKNMNCK